jgi:hypothetical protein
VRDLEKAVELFEYPDGGYDKVFIKLKMKDGSDLNFRYDHSKKGPSLSRQFDNYVKKVLKKASRVADDLELVEEIDDPNFITKVRSLRTRLSQLTKLKNKKLSTFGIGTTTIRGRNTVEDLIDVLSGIVGGVSTSKDAKSLTAAETFKCPNCDTKVLKQTGFCVKCKKKVKEGSERAPGQRLLLALKQANFNWEAYSDYLSKADRPFRRMIASYDKLNDAVTDASSWLETIPALRPEGEEKGVSENIKTAREVLKTIRKLSSNWKTVERALSASDQNDPWFTVDHVRGMCAACADKMERKGLAKIKRSHFLKAVGQDRYGKMTWEECIADAKKTGKTSPEKFCGWLYHHGPNAKS